ncbi:MAG: prepilin peptidase [Flavobacteriales bacterium]|nr:prepilin peptidase [Flavobacteriales bacterium]|tara:strand:+ start:156 stop:905 length:750 start_codon:yes stop_codon:yes gene_type:complete
MGLILGSFSNVLIYRLPIDKKGILTGRSFCIFCKQKLKWFDNIPLLSFINLNGKCRNCKKSISFRYIFIELFSAISFVLLYIYLDNIFEVVFYQIILMILMIIIFIDLKHFIIPDELNFTLIFLALIHNFFTDFNLSFNDNLFQSIIGGLVGYSVIWSIIFLYDKLKNIEAMGMGDAKLMAALGLFFGWQSVPFVLFFASIIGLIFVLPSILRTKKNLQTEIPFGPPIISAAILYFFKGEIIIGMIIKY